MTFLQEVIALEAKAMIREMRDHPMQVVLMPAPDPQHVGHMIRVVVSRPPDWYMDRFYRGKGRKTFKRHRFLDALKRVSLCAPVRGNYQTEILKYLNEKIGSNAE